MPTIRKNVKNLEGPTPIELPAPMQMSVDVVLTQSHGYRLIAQILKNGAHTLSPTSGNRPFQWHSQLVQSLYAMYNTQDGAGFLGVIQTYLSKAVGEFPHAGKNEDIDGLIESLAETIDTIQMIQLKKHAPKSGLQIVGAGLIAAASLSVI